MTPCAKLINSASREMCRQWIRQECPSNIVFQKVKNGLGGRGKHTNLESIIKKTWQFLNELFIKLLKSPFKVDIPSSLQLNIYGEQLFIALRKVSLAKLIGEYSKVSLSEAKEVTDNVLDNNQVVILVDNHRTKECIDRATEIAAVCE